MEINKDKILCIIPARGGSKGLPRKNIKILSGKPLIRWTMDEAKKSKYISKIVISTEDKEIAELVQCAGTEVVKRPMELAQDNTSTIDAILFTLKELEKSGYIPEYVVLLQCTSPLRTVKHIDEAIDLFFEHIHEVDSLVSLVKVAHPPWWYKKVDSKGHISDFLDYDKSKLSRRQDFPDIYNTNGAIYLIKTEQLIRYKDFELEKTMGYIMDEQSSIDIDTQIDFDIAERILKLRGNIN